MKVPLSWLREFVDLPVEADLAGLAHRLTMAGLEVEEVHTVGADWREVRVARVGDLAPHPRTEGLWVATLDLGGRSATVVTAATNLRVGALVPHVAAGGRLDGGDVGSRSFQGITSEGMVCSGAELDISPDRDGIYLLEDDTPPGTPFADVLGETVLDIYVTPNRPDCMSIMGIAREVHALTGAALRPLFSDLPRQAPPAGSTPASDLVAIRIEDPVGCPRFTAAVVRGVRIGPSPQWMQRRLYAAGVRPISNVVDVTNYVMLEVGQPLHAFDRQRLGDHQIVVRRARSGERLVTLDGEERTLQSELMVVADSTRPRSLAGVMGGLDSEIEDATTDVILEGASWDRASIRHAAGILGLQSEAARRFGRGVDPELTIVAVTRAADLTRQLAGGETAAGLVDVYPGRATPPTVDVRPSQIAALLGAPFGRQQVVEALGGLGFRVQPQGDAEDALLRVDVPSHRRFDVEHRADLAEEVARVVGYEAVPATLPSGRVPEPRADGDGGYGDELRARRVLAAAGLQEVMTYSLVDPGLAERLLAHGGGSDGSAAIPVVNPQSAELSRLRPLLLGSLLETARSTLRVRPRALLFEVARVWGGDLDPLPRERRHVGIVLCGARTAPSWTGDGEALDVFDLKGMVEALASAFGVALDLQVAQGPAEPGEGIGGSLHPGRSARVAAADGLALGWLGQLHPRVAERFDLPLDPPVLVAELDLDGLLGAGKARATAGTGRTVTPSRFPPAERDVAVVVDENVPHAALEAAIRAAGGPTLADLRLFDIYRGGQVPAGRKSLAYTLTFQAFDRTLGDEEVAAAHAAVETALRSTFGADIRGR